MVGVLPRVAGPRGTGRGRYERLAAGARQAAHEGDRPQGLSVGGAVTFETPLNLAPMCTVDAQ